jgi:fido (protein-threonine AMPylation protein)
LSPEQSLSLHAGNWTVPRQLAVRSPKGANSVNPLPHGTSMYELKGALPPASQRGEKDGVRVYTLEAALIEASPRYFRNHATDARTALSMVRDASDLLSMLLNGGHSTIAGRLAGAFRAIGRDSFANELTGAMAAASYTIRETDPFADDPEISLPPRETSPYVNRIRILWQKMRQPIIDSFPEAPGRPKNAAGYRKRVEAAYLTDAYHSLSIEGYQVTLGLIERVRAGAWNPDANQMDQDRRNAMAARGYWQAFQEVEESIAKVLAGKNPGAIAREDHRAWYRELFAPSVTAGLLQPADLAGYRGGQVFIRHSMHIPPNKAAVRDAMPAFFDLLEEEEDPAARAVLGHFVFVYIHPYSDGNGRMGRFLMNLMLASGGYPWTVIPVSARDAYMNALEKASVDEDIVPFAKFLAKLVKRRLAGEALPRIAAAG